MREMQFEYGVVSWTLDSDVRAYVPTAAAHVALMPTTTVSIVCCASVRLLLIAPWRHSTSESLHFQQ